MSTNTIQRPDLTRLDPQVRDYIEYLEEELDRHRAGKKTREKEEEIPSIPLEPSEPPTTINVVTITPTGIAKRTPRHNYTRQRRGGMGIFDIDTGEKEIPKILVTPDQSQTLILISTLARAFRFPVTSIFEGPVRSHGQQLAIKPGLEPGETLVAALPEQARGSIALLSERGMVRLLRHHVFGEHMKPGTALFDVRSFGSLVSACWTPGDGDLFIATQSGRAIRFSEKIIPPAGGPGIRLEGKDKPVAVASVYPDSNVFLLGADGRGTIRSMEGFNPNKSAGGGGKLAMTTDKLVSAVSIEDNEDIFAISNLSKIIRFMAAEVPVKDGVVQGVICMTLRADEVAAVTTSK
ncbi:MAG: hypothetical protein EHM41_16500 [Chloroflexi bacterium]|nr:MAG: hypothetical protein EHM41_16500 [Chloroflexota bacterium]